MPVKLAEEKKNKVIERQMILWLEIKKKKAKIKITIGERFH